MRCQDARELMSPYIDQFITEKERKMLEEHLAGCVECRFHLLELQQVVRSCRKLVELQAPPYFMDRFRERLQREKVAELPADKGHKSAVAYNWRGVVAVVAGLVLIVGVYASGILPKNMVSDLSNGIPKIESKNPPELVGEKDPASKGGAATDQKNHNEPVQVAQTGEGEETAPVGANTTGAAEGNISNQPSIENGATPAADQTLEEKYVDTVNLTMQVACTEQMLDSISQLAAANEGTASLVASQLMSGNTKQVRIRVPKDRVDEVIQGLREYDGSIRPMEGTMDITQEYYKVKGRLQEIDKEIQQLRQKNALNSEESQKLSVLEFEKNILNQKVVDINNQLQTVTINIQMPQEIKP